MRVLVLGGTGAMGEPLIKLLSERGDKVYVTSRRKSELKGSIHFIQGDAHDIVFIQELLKDHYDTIVDFMVYSTETFKERVNLYLNATNQYIFLSSARVYADSKEPITENTPRLLDVCKDKDYLRTDEYALAKARSENVLFNSRHRNWTIIRPYITYNTKRLQLGGLELVVWASRVSRYKSSSRYAQFDIVLPKDIAYKQTTMTHGEDVAKAFIELIGNPKALGEAFHITGKDHMRWIDVANIYRSVIQEDTGIAPNIHMPKNSSEISKFMGNYYQITYDRMYDRIFDDSKLMNACTRNTNRVDSVEVGGQLNFRSMDNGLRESLTEYLRIIEFIPLPLDYRFEAYIDRNIYKASSLKFGEFKDRKSMIKYLAYYYTPGVASELKKLRRLFRLC